MTRISSFLIVLALIAGLVGCQPAPAKRYTLTISSTAGGKVISPGEGTFAYEEGEVVELVAEADVGYQFAGWTGDVGTVADVGAATTTITMSGGFAIRANFRIARTGAFLDEVTITAEPSAEAAIQQLKDGALDVCAHALTDTALYAEVLANRDLAALQSLGPSWEFTYNPVGPVFPGTGKLNPFAVPEFREAMHWLVNREYIAEEIIGGLAVPMYTCLSPYSADAKERYPDLIAAIKAKYVHNSSKAADIINAEMHKLGAVRQSGKWMYNGEPVELLFLIRADDKRKDIGEYFAELLRDAGFTVRERYGTLSELWEFWTGDPGRGVFHVYTGGWGGGILRDEAGKFAYHYTSLGRGDLLWQAYINGPAFRQAAERLRNGDFGTMAERRQLFDICLEQSMKENQRMFIVTVGCFSPVRANVRLAHDLADGILHSSTWALTAHFVEDGDPVVGGTLRVATPDLLCTPWNAIDGMHWVYDMFAVRATSDAGVHRDTRTGLPWAGHIEKAEIFVKAGLPVIVTNTNWCSLAFVPEIEVPVDAWVDWDARQQKFITAQEKYGSGRTTAKTKVVSYYPKDVFGIPLHDGSTLSMGDFVLCTILQWDRGRPESAIYDEAYVGELNNFMGTFKGIKFITDNPNYGLIVEYYSDQWKLDAELIVTTMFPFYSRGPGMWHTMALGIKAEEDKALAFSRPKSGRLGVEWMNFIAGPSLSILKSKLDSAKAANYIPYEPTMGRYVTKAEAAQRWSNLTRWYEAKKHFWVASGPFYLESVDTAKKIVHLKRFEGYPDPADRWLFLLDPLP